MPEPPRDAKSGGVPGAAQHVSWLLGAALVVAVIVAALHFSEGREFARLVERANPWWLLLALALQGATYLAQAEVFRGAPRVAGAPLPRRWLYQLSLTKLFLDQALPSAGISSAVVVTKALQQRGVPRDVAGGRDDQHRVVPRRVCGHPARRVGSTRCTTRPSGTPRSGRISSSRSIRIRRSGSFWR